MDIQAKKIVFIQKFLGVEDEQIIDSLKKKLDDELKKDQMNPMSLKEFNSRINQSLADAQEGRLTSNDRLIKEIKKWH